VTGKPARQLSASKADGHQTRPPGSVAGRNRRAAALCSCFRARLTDQTSEARGWREGCRSDWREHCHRPGGKGPVRAVIRARRDRPSCAQHDIIFDSGPPKVRLCCARGRRTFAMKAAGTRHRGSCASGCRCWGAIADNVSCAREPEASFMTVPNGAKSSLRARCLPPGSVRGSCAGPLAFAADGRSPPGGQSARFHQEVKRTAPAVVKTRSLAALASCRGARGRGVLTSGR